MTDEHCDVLVVGAGLSGLAAGYYLQTRCPGLQYTILEGRAGLGGTWDLFRYPGIRSDSDMFTLGFSFRPWQDPGAIAAGPAILDYLRDTARECGLDRHIRFGHRVRAASWSSASGRWTVEAEAGPDRAPVRLTARFLDLCSGYYDYEEGYSPDFPGREDFAGPVVHPQHWPADLDCRGRRVAVIGSGATAVTLVPALARDAAHVTMLQRSPSYVLSIPADSRLARRLLKVLPGRAASWLVRWRNILLTHYFYRLCRRSPHRAKKFFRDRLARELPAGFDLDRHFQPAYDPWDQRVCFVPDSDLFRALRDGRASVVTDRIARFTRRGIRLASGGEVEADVIVTATGLKLLPCGGIRLSVDGEPVDPGRCLIYKGVMLGGVPNLAVCLGYANASWTLRAELSAAYLCRVLNLMRRRGHTCFVPRPGPSTLPARPLIGLTSGYVRRGEGLFPRQGEKAPWVVPESYLPDLVSLSLGRVDDGTLAFTRSPASRAD